MSTDLPSWEQAVITVVRAIPAGAVLSYGEVARRAGRPGHARQVARLLAANPDPQLPWHRVLRADGRPGLAPGSEGYRTQCTRLGEEGVAVDGGRVRIRHTPACGLDALLWAPGST